MKDKNDETAWDRRGFLTCMAWVGTGAVWTMTSGILKGMPIEEAARAGAGTGGLRFVQISDTHIGFNRDANPDVTSTLLSSGTIDPSTGHPADPSQGNLMWLLHRRWEDDGRQLGVILP